MRLLPTTRSTTAERRDSLENPGIPLSSPQAWALIAGEIGTNSGVNISEFTALRTMAVWRCIALISGTIAQMPLHAWQGRRGDSNRKAIEFPLFEDPNPEISIFELIETSLVHDLLWGNGYWLKIGNNAGDGVAQVWSLPPWSTFVTRDDTQRNGVPGQKVYRVNVGNGLKLTDADVVHFPGLGYDGIRGLSPIAHAREGLGLGVASEQYAAKLFGNGSLMGGMITTDKDLTDDQAETIKARWRQRMTGINKAHEVAVMDSGAKFTPLTIPPEDAQFLQSRQFSVEETCRLYGVPPHLAMMVDKTTSWGAGIAEQSVGFHRYTLTHWTGRYENRLTKFLLPKGVYAEFDSSQMLKGDTAARYAAYAVARATGWLNGSEIRKFENLPPINDPALDAYGPVVITPPALPGGGGKDPKGD